MKSLSPRLTSVFLMSALTYLTLGSTTRFELTPQAHEPGGSNMFGTAPPDTE